MSDQEKIKELKEALKVAANALSIASDWNVDRMELEVPKEWDLDDEGEEEGWYSTSSLEMKLRQLSD